MRYSIEPKDRIIVKGYGFLSFTNYLGTQLSNKDGEKLLDSAKILTTDAIKTPSKRAIQKTAEATGDLTGNKIADKIWSVSEKFSVKLQPQNNEDNDELEVPKTKINISRRKTTNYWWIKVSMII